MPSYSHKSHNLWKWSLRNNQCPNIPEISNFEISGSQPLKLSDMGSLINPNCASSLQARKGKQDFRQIKQSRKKMAILSCKFKLCALLTLFFVKCFNRSCWPSYDRPEVWLAQVSWVDHLQVDINVEFGDTAQLRYGISKSVSKFVSVSPDTISTLLNI